MKQKALHSDPKKEDLKNNRLEVLQNTLAHHRVSAHFICDLLKLLKLCKTRVHCEPNVPAGDLHGTVEDVGGRVWCAVEPLIGLGDPAEELLVEWRQSVAMLAE